MKRIFTGFLAALALSSCALGPDYERPEISVPTIYRAQVDNSSSITNLPWWELYRDPNLLSLIRKALVNNQDLGIALARIEEAEAVLGITRADLYPELNVSASLGKNEFSNDLRRDEERESYTIATPLFWELDIFGKLRRATEASRAELLATEEFARAVRLSLIADTANTYFLLLDLENRKEISIRTQKSRKEATAIIQARFNEGYIAEIDLFQAQVQEEIATAAVHAFTRQLRQAENALSILIGEFPKEIERNTPLQDQLPLPHIPEGLPSELLKRRPDVLQAEHALHAQTARIGVAEALRFPSLALTGTFGVESLDLDEFNFDRDKFWSFETDILGPIFSYNRNISRVRAEEARTKQLALEYYKSVLEAFRDVEDSLIAVQTYKEEHAARKREVQAGKSAAELSRARYDAGQTSYLEVLDIERSLFSSELDESEALRERLSSVVLLYKALGGGWQEEPKNN